MKVCKYFVLVIFGLLVSGGSSISAAEYYVSKDGKDSHEGTKIRPFATIQQAATKMSSGDTCYIGAGTYRESVNLTASGTSGKEVRFIAMKPRSVIIDGTNVVHKKWRKYKDKAYQVDLPESTELVFYNKEPMTWARWPNMKYSENWLDEKKWARSGAGSKPGTVHCAELKQLKGTNLVGTYCFIKYAKGNNTYSRKVTEWNPSKAMFKWDDTGFYDRSMTAEDGESGSPGHSQELLDRLLKNNEFYLSGSLALLDSKEEWFYDKNKGCLYLVTPDGKKPTPRSVQYKARDFGMTGENLEFVTIEGVDFFGCSLRFGGINQRIKLKDCRFHYPDEELVFPDRKAVEDEFKIKPVSITGLNCTVSKCLFTGSSRSSLVLSGGGHEVIDCVVTEGNRHGRHDDKAIEVRYRANEIRLKGKEKKHRQLEKERGKNVVRNCTVYNNGGIAIYLLGSSPQHGGGVVSFNHLFNNNRYCVDISSIYVPMGNRWRGGGFHHNWIHNANGLAYRVDIMGEDVNYHHNVTWETGSGYEAEGYSYQVTNNTTILENKSSWHQVIISQHRFLGIDDKDQHDYTFPTVQDWVVCNNLAYRYTDRVSLRELPKFRESRKQRILAKGRGNRFQQVLKQDVGNIHHNFVVNNPEDLFVSVDPANLDLRPRKGSPLIDAGCVTGKENQNFHGRAPDIGAYEYGGEYWYPGASWLPDGLAVPETMASANNLAIRLQQGSSFAGKKKNVIELTR